MSKKTTFLPEAIFTFDDTTVVLLKTSFANYQFIMAFNKAYQLELARVDDVVLKDIPYHCFSYYDESARLAYVMIETPTAGPAYPSPLSETAPRPPFDYYDKMLLIRGRDAWDFQNRLYHDLTDRLPEPDKNDWLIHSDWEHIQLLKEGVFTIDTCSFYSQLEGVRATTLYTGPAEKMPTATKTQLRQLRAFLTTTFDVLQWHLLDEEEL